MLVEMSYLDRDFKVEFESNDKSLYSNNFFKILNIKSPTSKTGISTILLVLCDFFGICS